MKYSSNYDLSLNLLVGDPGDAKVTWDIKTAIERILNFYYLVRLQPFLSKFKNLYSFSVSSQIQNYANLPIVPNQAEYQSKKIFTLSPKELTTFINSAEWNLGKSLY
jgi:hypothetical protein